MKKNHIRKITSVCILVITLLLASCSSTSKNGVYTVRKGETLSTIAWKHNTTPAYLQRINKISNPNKIHVGQKLIINKNSTYIPPKKKVANKKPKIKTVTYSGKDWVWPIKGNVISNFRPGKIGGNGIRILGKPNQTVNAAQSGTVAYKGNGLSGYGNVIIIKHGNGILSAYGFLNKTFVKEGQKVNKKDKIGTVGRGGNRKLMLHFEVRKNANPVNPKIYIGSKYYF